MLTLVITALLSVYLLGPDLVSRFVLGFVCPSKVIVQSKSEEATRAVAWALVPLLLALLWARFGGHLAQCAGPAEWKTFFSGLHSPLSFEALRKNDQFFRAAAAVWWWNVSVLWRLYFLVIAFWVTVDVLIVKFGRIRRHGKKHTSAKILTYFLELFVIPRVSDWHLYLSGMLTEYKDVQVHADILGAGEVMYSGRVARKELASDGTLASITLESPKRFRREHYLKACDVADAGSTVDPNEFWKKIPGTMFVVLGKDISTINLRHSSSSAAATDPDILERLRKLLEDYDRARS